MAKNKKNKNTGNVSPPNKDTLVAKCKKATELFDQKKEHLANSEMEKIKNQYKSSAFFHHVNSAVKSALHFNSSNHDHFQESLVSAYLATILSPTSIDYSSNYIRILLDYSKNYEHAIKECVRALAVDRPTAIYGNNEGLAFYQEQLQNFLTASKNYHFEVSKEFGFKDKELFSSSDIKFTEVRETCLRAICFINRKEYQNADHLMQEESRAFHYAFGAFHATFALVKYYVQRVQESIFFARDATLLCQNNIHYSLFYIELLLSCDFSVENFEEAAKECRRALAVNEPVDSFIDRYGESEDVDAERMFSYRKKIEYIVPKITTSHCINIASFKEYCGSFENKFLDNLLKKVLSSPWKIWFCPKCDQVEFEDSALLMSHILSTHEHEYKFPDKLITALPKKVDDGWKLSIDNDASEPLKGLLEWDYIAESHFQFIWKYILEEDGDFELTDIAGKIKKVTGKKLDNYNYFLSLGENQIPGLIFESAKRNDDDDAHSIDYDVSTESIKLDQYAFPYKHNPSTFDNFKSGPREDNVALGKKIISEWNSYNSCRMDEGKKIFKAIKDNSLYLIESCDTKQGINSAYLVRMKNSDEKLGADELSSMHKDLNSMASFYLAGSTNSLFDPDEYFAAETCHKDAQILPTLARIDEYKKKVGEICVLDYSKLLAPLFKLYVQNQMIDDERKGKWVDVVAASAGN